MIRFLIDVYAFLLLLYWVAGLVPKLQYMKGAQELKYVCDFTLDPVRKILPLSLPVDISPLIVIGLTRLIKLLW